MNLTFENSIYVKDKRISEQIKFSLFISFFSFFGGVKLTDTFITPVNELLIVIFSSYFVARYLGREVFAIILRICRCVL